MERARDRRRGWDQGGFALASALTAGTVLTLLAAATISYGIGSQSIGKRDQDWNAALAAAEAGIDDYLFRLNENGNYWQYSALVPPPDGNQAFTNWVTVPGGGTTAQFTYTPDVSTIATDGRVRLTATGRVGSTTRTVQANLRRRSFLDYLYFTDYETVDPALYTGSPFTPAVAQTRCAKYYYGGFNNQRDVNGRVDFTGDSDSGGSYCSDIVFIGIDTLNGPMHTNDAFMVCGSPSFLGDTSTSWTGANGKLYRDNCPTSSPVFANPTDPQHLAPLTMPPSNSAIKAETAAGLGGCLYTGPTRIKLNSNGTMTVNSPFSKNTNNAPCPKNGTAALPSNGVVYVQNVPSLSSDPNYTGGCPYNVNGRSHPLGMPIASDLNSYGCRNGDVFVEGTLQGQLTIAAENNIVATWHLQYQSGLSGTDLLGLVANNFVEIYHPVSCTSQSSSCNLNANFPLETPRNVKFTEPNLYAANLSVNHSVRVQMWSRGSPLGSFHVRGVLAQRYRGPVGTNSSGTIVSGYGKDYVYDQRLKYLSPPKFLDPVASQWGVNTWAENKAPSGLPA
jgi:hypothetical protein